MNPNQPTAITTVIFDLDGTLMNTLEDLADSVNYALRTQGFPQRTLGEVRCFVGNGIHKLMERAVPGGEANPRFESAFASFKSYYVDHCRVKTCLYDGIEALLQTLKARGYKTAIVSNKLQSGVDALYTHYFSHLIDVAVGECPEVRRKPYPDMVEQALKLLHSTAQEAIYVGDSDVDIATAHNAGLPCISVLWGFRDEDFLKAHGATHLARCPQDVLAALGEQEV